MTQTLVDISPLKDRDSAIAIDALAATVELYRSVPIVADGFAASDGAITTATNQFVSASASFTSADVGKLITINGAGPTRYFGSATIGAGGAGYVRGDTIVLAGGTKTATASVVVRSVSGGAVTAVAGLAGSLGTYTVVPTNNVAQTSTSGVGVGATFVASWLRDNLVTTIIEVVNATTVRLGAIASATVSGAIWGYGSDYSTEINDAIATGERINLPTGRIGIASSISIDSVQSLIGNGTGGYDAAATELIWLGAVGGTMLKFDTGTLINGAKAGPFNVYGLGAASYGVLVRGLAHSTVDIQVRSVKDFGYSFQESTDGLYDVFFNDFKCVVAVNHTSAQSAVGLSFPYATISSGAHDVNGNRFYNTAVFARDGNCIDLIEGYMNAFFLTQCFNTGNGWSIRFGGSTVNDVMTARANVFYEVLGDSSGGGKGILSEGRTYSARQNRLLPLDRIFVATPVVVETGSTLFVTGSHGDDNLGSQHAYYSASAGNPTGTATTANYVMMGAAGAFTPNYTGRVLLCIDGAIINNSAGGGALLTLFHGTGTAPSNGDGETGTQAGGFPALVNTPSTTFSCPFSITTTINGLTAGTAHWFDLGVKAVTSGTASAKNVRLSATELP